MADKLRVGIIGSGAMTANHTFGYLRSAKYEVVALADLSEQAMSDFDNQFAEYSDYRAEHFVDAREMLSNVELDVVSVGVWDIGHAPMTIAAAVSGVKAVLCEKPMTMTVAEAEELQQLVDSGDVPFILAHTYTGHPMLMMAKEFIRRGDLGDIRKVEAWYNQGWLATALENEGLQQAEWRADPARTGISNCGGDIGTHAFVAATWTTGLGLQSVSARLNSFVEGRVLDDDFNVIGVLDNGGTAIITATQIAIGYKNDNGLRVFGSEGSIEWHQEEAAKLVVRRGEADEVYWIGANFSYLPEAVQPYVRMPGGHHEDFFEALANLHLSMEFALRRGRGEDAPAPFDHPGVASGVAGMRFVAAAVASSSNSGAWTEL